MIAPVPPSLPVVETFHSLQGEGLHAGRSAFFIRLAGCSVGCPWCDTRHSWEAEDHPRRSLAELAQELAAAADAGAAFAVVTGGEPLEHDLGPLCEALQAATGGLPLHLETSGVSPLPLSGRFAWITLSPKRHRPPSPELLAACDELKVVVHEPADLAFAEAMAEQALAARASLAAGSEPRPAGVDAPLAAAVGVGLDSGTITAQADAARAAVVCVDTANETLAPADGSGLNPEEARAPAVASLLSAARQDRATRQPPVGLFPVAGSIRDHANDRLPDVAGSAIEPAAPPAQATRPCPALLLQPGWNSRRGQELAIDFVRSHPAWRLSLQSHKWLGVR